MALTVVPAYFAATVNLEVSINLETSSITDIVQGYARKA
jgi:hypothetical protein